MAFDPNKPATNAEITSAELREQFNALNDRLVAVESALQETARDPVGVGTFTTTLNDPPGAAQVQAILDVLNQLISAVKRN